MSTGELAGLVGRLEAVTKRLESVASGSRVAGKHCLLVVSSYICMCICLHADFWVKYVVSVYIRTYVCTSVILENFLFSMLWSMFSTDMHSCVDYRKFMFSTNHASALN